MISTGWRPAPGWPAAHPCRRADARGRGQPEDHRPPPGRAADGAHGARPALVPDPCDASHDGERDGIARSGAVAGLCPITESSLGDGIFDGVRYRDAGGRFGVGSDSNIQIDAGAELRQLEYSQRLRDRGRALMAEPAPRPVSALWQGLCRRRASLRPRHRAYRAGCRADLVTLDCDHPALVGKAGEPRSTAPSSPPTPCLCAMSSSVAGEWCGRAPSRARAVRARFATGHAKAAD
jgi:hypothetical protein